MCIREPTLNLLISNFTYLFYQRCTVIGHFDLSSVSYFFMTFFWRHYFAVLWLADERVLERVSAGCTVSASFSPQSSVGPVHALSQHPSWLSRSIPLVSARIFWPVVLLPPFPKQPSLLLSAWNCYYRSRLQANRLPRINSTRVSSLQDINVQFSCWWGVDLTHKSWCIWCSDNVVFYKLLRVYNTSSWKAGSLVRLNSKSAVTAGDPPSLIISVAILFLKISLEDLLVLWWMDPFHLF